MYFCCFPHISLTLPITFSAQMITRDSITKVLDIVQIEDVVSDYVNLKKRGANYIGLCPFHNEKTPSFTVSPVKGIFKCFGCGVAGDSVKFLMEHDSFSYPEAIRHLASKYHIELEETEESQEELEQQNMRESLLIVNKFANEYFQESLLNTEEGKTIGLSYFKERGFRENTIKKFELGYCPDAKDAFTKTALQKQYKLEYLQQLGLTNQNQIDIYRGRVIFPIHNLSGKVIAFGARTLKSDKKIPKYINSPESDIYHKSRSLYGIYFAKKAIRQQDECLLVEGYTDVISMHQAGIENVIASSGTSLTEDQIRLIKRFTPNVTIIYDGDAAGMKASFRGIDLILEQDLNVKIVPLPDGEDPDSFVQKKGASGFSEYLEENRKDFILFKTDLLRSETNDDPVKMAGLIQDIVTSIAKVPDGIKRSLFTRQCSSILNVDEQVLVSELNKIRRKAFKKKLKKQEQEETQEPVVEIQESPAKHIQKSLSNSTLVSEKEILRILLEYGDREISENVRTAEYIVNELEDISMEDAMHQKVYDEIAEQIRNGSEFSSRQLLSHEDEAIVQFVIDITSSPHELSDNWFKKHEIVVKSKEENFVQDVYVSVARLQLRQVEKQDKEIQQQIKACSDDEELMALLHEKQKIKQMQSELCKFLGTVITG